MGYIVKRCGKFMLGEFGVDFGGLWRGGWGNEIGCDGDFESDLWDGFVAEVVGAAVWIW